MLRVHAVFELMSTQTSGLLFCETYLLSVISLCSNYATCTIALLSVNN